MKIGQIYNQLLTESEDKFIIQNKLDGIIQRYEAMGMACWIYLKGDYAIEIASIKIKDKLKRRQGLGSQIMSEIIGLCEDFGLLCVLTPSDTESSMAGLLRFYKRFGFVSNQGRNKDFRFRNTMIRYPKKQNVAKKKDD